ncbi:MAG: methionyl-tRNA formyltransferase [Pyrinomonadaceae bacterium]
MNVLLVCEESAGIQTLRAVAGTTHRIVGVMASPTRKSNGGGLSAWQLATNMGFRTWPAKLVTDPAFADVVRAEGVDLLLNVHSLYIIAPEIVGAPRIGSFNLHPGPLPRYAGLNPVSWALYRGESTHGVTVHRMEATIDTGPIAYQSLFPVKESDTALSVWTRCSRQGVRLLLRLMQTAEPIPLVPQDLTKREYFGAEIPPLDNLFCGRTAKEIINLVRACDFFPFASPWGNPKARLGNRVIGIVKGSRTGQQCSCPPGSVGERVSSGVLVASTDEWILLEKLLVDGQLVNGGDVLHSGDRLEVID